MRVSLPVLDHLEHLDPGSRACATCHGGCCVEYSVPLGGYDLVRLSRGLGLPWEAIAGVEEHRVPVDGAVRLDRGPVHTSFVLRRRETEACIFLVEVSHGDELYRRCGVHGLRPDACRIYPGFHAEGGGTTMAPHAICPPPQAAMYRDALASIQPLLDEDAHEQALYARILGRWDPFVSRIKPQGRVPIAVFVAWLDAVYQAIEPLRHRGPRAEWQLSALSLVDQFPLPSQEPV